MRFRARVRAPPAAEYEHGNAIELRILICRSTGDQREMSGLHFHATGEMV